MAALSSLSKEMRADAFDNRVVQGHELGKRLAAKAIAQGVEAVVFDRGAFQYHGIVKAVADGAREGGLRF